MSTTWDGPNEKTGVNSSAREGQAVPASYQLITTTVMLMK